LLIPQLIQLLFSYFVGRISIEQHLEVTTDGWHLSGEYFLWNDFKEVKKYNYFGYRFIRFYPFKYSWRSYKLGLNLYDYDGLRFALEDVLECTYKQKLLAILPSEFSKPPIIKYEIKHNYNLKDSAKKMKKKLYKRFFVFFFIAMVLVLALKKSKVEIKDFSIIQSITEYMFGIETLKEGKAISDNVFPVGTKVFYSNKKMIIIEIRKEGQYYGLTLPKGTSFSIHEGKIGSISSSGNFSYGKLIFPGSSLIIIEGNGELLVYIEEDFIIGGIKYLKGTSLVLKDNKIVKLSDTNERK
jgi:hypothetical protein